MPRTDSPDVVFVILAGVLADGSIGYADEAGAVVALDRAGTWPYRSAMDQAGALARGFGQPVCIVPLLFGVPDVEALIRVPPGSAPGA